MGFLAVLADIKNGYFPRLNLPIFSRPSAFFFSLEQRWMTFTSSVIRTRRTFVYTGTRMGRGRCSCLRRRCLRSCRSRRWVSISRETGCRYVCRPILSTRVAKEKEILIFISFLTHTLRPPPAFSPCTHSIAAERLASSGRGALGCVVDGGGVLLRRKVRRKGEVSRRGRGGKGGCPKSEFQIPSFSTTRQVVFPMTRALGLFSSLVCCSLFIFFFPAREIFLFAVLNGSFLPPPLPVYPRQGETVQIH